MSAKPSAEYYERIKALDSVLRECIVVSQECAGIRSPTGAHYHASLLFTSLCTRTMTLAIMAPHSPWAKKKLEHWDYSSMAGVTRSILEVRLAFYYLCVESVPAGEWYCRWNIFNLHDCIGRIHLFQSIMDGHNQIAGLEKQADELRARLMSNEFFCSLPESKKKEILRGKNAYILPLEEIGVKAGVDLIKFRWIYKFLSTQVHGHPMSYYRNAEQNRGRGVHSQVEEQYTVLCLSFVASLLARAKDEMRDLFSGVNNA